MALAVVGMIGAGSIGMLLADREFAGADWLNWLNDNDTPFTIRLAQNRLIIRPYGREVKLTTMVTLPRKGRYRMGTLEGMDRPLHFSARLPRGGEWVIVVTNRAGHDALQTYRKRWAIEQLFANCKTRGLNLEDTRLTDPAKLHLPTALIVLAVAWSVRAARTLPGNTAPPRKAHGYLAQSYFRTGITFLRNRLGADRPDTLIEWTCMLSAPSMAGVV